MSPRPGGAARHVRSVLVLALVLLVAGCASLPTTGRVVAGGDVDQQGARAALRVAAAGPAPGADERAVVEGFLAAVAGLDDYTVAREFLAPDVRDWRPADRTVVHQGLGAVTSQVDGDTATVTLSPSVVARIDGNGRYTSQQAAVEEQVFELVQVDGEWRIAELPPGVLVSRVDADRVLTDFGVYFPDPTGTYLVPDVRWFPQLPASATSLVRALLAGPSAPYLGALETAVPEGTRLDLPTVPVEDGVATVDLTEDVLSADPAQRTLLLAQLRQTLRAVPGVTDVVVTVDGAPLPEATADGTTTSGGLRVDPSVDDRPYVLGPLPRGADDAGAGAGDDDAGPGEGTTPSDGASAAADGPGAADAGEADAGATDAGAGDAGAADADPGEPEQRTEETEPVLGADGRPLAPEGSLLLRLDLDGGDEVPGTRALSAVVRTGLAASYDGGTFAGLDADLSAMWVQQPGSPPVQLVTGQRLTPPSFDPPPLGWVWTVTTDADADRPQVLAAAAGVEEVEARWLAPGDEVRSLRISRDGARALVVLVRADGRVLVEVRGVRRDTAGQPVSLSQAAFRVAPQLLDAVDADWVNDDQVVVLGRSGEEPLRPFVAQVGGDAEPLAPTPGAATVSSGFGERSVVVGTVDGTVLRRSGSLWIDGPFGVAPTHRG